MATASHRSLLKQGALLGSPPRREGPPPASQVAKGRGRKEARGDRAWKGDEEKEQGRRGPDTRAAQLAWCPPRVLAGRYGPSSPGSGLPRWPTLAHLHRLLQRHLLEHLLLRLLLLQQLHLLRLLLLQQLQLLRLLLDQLLPARGRAAHAQSARESGPTFRLGDALCRRRALAA